MKGTSGRGQARRRRGSATEASAGVPGTDLRGPGRARGGQPQGIRPPDNDSAGPPIPPEIEAKQLAPEIRRELNVLFDRATADAIARHLVAAGELIDEDPEAALSHAQAARARSGRIAAVREAVGITSGLPMW